MTMMTYEDHVHPLSLWMFVAKAVVPELQPWLLDQSNSACLKGTGDWRSSSLHLMKPLVVVAVFQRYWRFLTGFCREQNGPKIVLAPQTRTSCMMWQKRDSNLSFLSFFKLVRNTRTMKPSV